jgi:hypothetical protein
MWLPRELEFSPRVRYASAELLARAVRAVVAAAVQAPRAYRTAEVLIHGDELIARPQTHELVVVAGHLATSSELG